MSTEAEVEAAEDAFFAAFHNRRTAHVGLRAALAAVEPLLRERLAQEVEAAAPKTAPGGEWDDRRPRAAAFYDAARIVRGDAS